MEVKNCDLDRLTSAEIALRRQRENWRQQLDGTVYAGALFYGEEVGRAREGEVDERQT